MLKEDFIKMLKNLQEQITSIEITHVFKHFDSGNTGYVTKSEFVKAFKRVVRDQSCLLYTSDAADE